MRTKDETKAIVEAMLESVAAVAAVRGKAQRDLDSCDSRCHVCDQYLHDAMGAEGQVKAKALITLLGLIEGAAG